jgi:arylsulfatase A
VPFIVRWPAKVKAGSVNNSIVCTTDFFRTAADVAGVSAKIEVNTAEDSVSFLPALLGDDSAARLNVINHSYGGAFAIRRGKWKLELCPDSGRDDNIHSTVKNKKNAPPLQLYNLEADPAEANNLYGTQPELVRSLVTELASQIKNGRSTVGAQQQNDTPIPFSDLILSLFPELKN